MAKYRSDLPQLADRVFLTDGGIETTLIFHHGRDLPHFASFVLMQEDEGRRLLLDYFRTHANLAAADDAGFILEAPTWHASRDWAQRIGYSDEALDAANRAAIDLMVELRREYERPEVPVVISGCIGPRGDAYRPEQIMTPSEAEEYHTPQVRTFSETEADLVTALTMTHAEEAIGVTRAAQAHGIPVAVAFTVETDGRLPSGASLGDAVRAVDDATDAGPAYFMVNCAHPTHFDHQLTGGDGWVERIRGLRANASTMSHAELDEAEELDAGDPDDLGARYADLRERLPLLTVLGGCCGTDHRHIEAIRNACLPERHPVGHGG